MGQRNPETFTTALCEEIKKEDLCSAKQTMSRIELWIQKAWPVVLLRALCVGTCGRERGEERKRKVGRGLRKTEVYVLNKYTLMLPSQEYVSPEVNTANIAIETYCIYKCSSKTRQHKLGWENFCFFPDLLGSHLEAAVPYALTLYKHPHITLY